MGLTASLDIGSEKMVMAVAAEENGSCRLKGIKMIALQGVENGMITDKSKVKSYVRYLMKELAKDKPIDRIRVALPVQGFTISEHKVNVPLQRHSVKMGDINRAEAKCAELFAAKGGEIVDLIPIAYAVDRGNSVTNPIGMSGRSLDVRYRVYRTDADYLKEWRDLIAECGIEEVDFFPAVRAYMEALEVYDSEKRFALVDMGAAHTGVMLFNDGMLEHEAILPLGTCTIESDIMQAFRIDELQKAKKMKHSHGEALKMACKNEKIEIPDARKQIEKRDLVKVIQCRLEELMEGAVYQMQQWRFNETGKEVLLTGGGSRIRGSELLLEKLSGHKVERAKAKGVMAGDDILEAPACLVALGLLLCEHVEPEEEEGGIGKWFMNIFK